MEKLETRKKDHIDLAFSSQTLVSEIDPRFYYEPMLSKHPDEGLKPMRFLGKNYKVPIWVSSMTGGTKEAGIINRNLARACNEFGMGMGLGSCRIILDDDRFFEDFNMRPIIGEQPLWANLGIAQIEELLDTGKVSLAEELVKKLEADGLILHVNPMQEWFQPEGDTLRYSPIETIEKFLDKFSFPLIVKEVGQGMGPDSLKALLKLPLQAIEFAAFGGTNFARVELLREKSAQASLFEPLSHIGISAPTMVDLVNEIVREEDPVCKELIISGGIRNFLDGYYLISKSSMSSVYGMASEFLRNAREDYGRLREFVEGQIKGLEMANAFLRIRE